MPGKQGYFALAAGVADQHTLGFDTRNEAVDREILRQYVKDFGIGLKRAHAAGWTDKLAKKRGVIADIGADLDDCHAGFYQRHHRLGYFGFPTSTQDNLRRERQVARIDKQALPVNRRREHPMIANIDRLAVLALTIAGALLQPAKNSSKPIHLEPRRDEARPLHLPCRGPTQKTSAHRCGSGRAATA